MNIGEIFTQQVSVDNNKSFNPNKKNIDSKNEFSRLFQKEYESKNFNTNNNASKLNAKNSLNQNQSKLSFKEQTQMIENNDNNNLESPNGAKMEAKSLFEKNSTIVEEHYANEQNESMDEENLFPYDVLNLLNIIIEDFNSQDEAELSTDTSNKLASIQETLDIIEKKLLKQVEGKDISSVYEAKDTLVPDASKELSNLYHFIKDTLGLNEDGKNLETDNKLASLKDSITESIDKLNYLLNSYKENHSLQSNYTASVTMSEEIKDNVNDSEYIGSKLFKKDETEIRINTVEDTLSSSGHPDNLLSGEKDLGFQINITGTSNPITDNVINPLNNFNYVKEAEVIEQIIQKARVHSNGDSSEIKIRLKPDFLGEVSLRITTEKGIVVARAIVENNQVKHLLESNLDKLKDNFKEQGMMFQKLDVSVGHESNHRSPNWNFNGGKKRQNFKGTKAIAVDSESSYFQQTENPYLQNKEGSVDYRA